VNEAKKCLHFFASERRNGDLLVANRRDSLTDLNPDTIFMLIFIYMNKIKDIYWITVLFLLPILLLYTGVIPMEYLRFVLFAFVLVTVWLVRREHWSLRELGIRKDNLVKLIPAYAIFTAIGVIVIILAAKVMGIGTIDNWAGSSHLLFWFIPISVAQEFIFRGYYLTKLKSVYKSPIMAISLNVVVFAVMHIIYPNPLFTLLVGAISGLGFAMIYYYKPNLILISISHTILNFVAVYYCFFGQ